MKESDVQKLAKERLDKYGYAYWFPPRTWGERDILGVFDFIAFSKRGQILLVQITTIQHLSDRRKKIAVFLSKHDILHADKNIRIWAWDKRINDFQVRKLK